MKKRLMILDGSSLMFRAFYALPLLSSPSGEYVNAVHGFSSMLVKMIETYHPDFMSVAFDKSRRTFRTELYSEYKGTRAKTPEEFSSQVPILIEFLASWGIRFIELDRYEADDIIGTLASRAARDGGYETLIVTGDRDALQLVREGVTVLFTKKGISDIVVFDERAFREKYGFAPEKLIDLKGLMGDSSDNIPGVPGVGEKTAMKLVKEYGSLDGVYQNIAKIPGKKLKERLTENEELARLSRRLATIDCDAPVDFSPESSMISPDVPRLLRFFDRYGLNAARRGFLKLYPDEPLFEDEGDDAPPKDEAASPTPRFIVIDTSDAAKSFSREARRAGWVAFIGRYSGKVPHVSMTAAGLATDGMTAFAAANAPGWDEIFSLLNDGSLIRKTFDVKRFYHAGGIPSKKFFDVSLAGYISSEMGETRVKKLHEGLFDEASDADYQGDAAKKYASQACTIAKISDEMSPAVESAGLKSLYDEMELPLSEVLYEMERTGIFVNRDRLVKEDEAALGKLETLREEIHDLAGHPFNVNSTKQLGTVLFEELCLPPQKKTKSGYSTDVSVLEALKGTHPIIEKLLSYRVWAKLKSTYLDGIAQLIDEKTGRVHTSFNQTVTATGRLSSSDPNLQNIPVRTEEGRAIRRLFEPGDGYDLLMSADYSQIELRILAHLSGDESFVEAFMRGEDIHARTASEVFGVPMEDVTSEMRRHAKAVNFGIVYGISDYGLAKGIGISRKDAAKYIESYFAKCAGVKRFLDQTVLEARMNGFVTTMFGRRRELPAISSKNYGERSLAERMAMNTPIQGSAADIIKLAMIRAHESLKSAGMKSRILLQVHDELVLEVVESEAPAVKRLLTEAMEGAAKLRVKLAVDINFGKNWAEAK